MLLQQDEQCVAFTEDSVGIALEDRIVDAIERFPHCLVFGSHHRRGAVRHPGRLLEANEEDGFFRAEVRFDAVAELREAALGFRPSTSLGVSQGVRQQFVAFAVVSGQQGW